MMNTVFTMLLFYQALDVGKVALEDPSTKVSVSFLAFGDWGGLSFHPFTTPVQTSVADQMTKVAAQEKADFVVALGDNFYLFGVENVDDPRFQTTFESVYHTSSLHIPWYVVAGNHDYFGNVSAQIAYTKRSNRWKFPDYYHKVSETIPGGKTLEIVLIDTIQLCGNVYAIGVQPAGPADKKAAEAQWNWIEKTLNESTADYLLVGGHFPVYSVAEHGPTDCLIQRLEPLLYRYNVSAYMAGHDHQLQHIQMSKDGQTMDYYNIGAGNFVEQSKAHISSIPSENLKFYFADLMYLGGFSFFEVTDTEMKIKFIDGVDTRTRANMSGTYTSGGVLDNEGWIDAWVKGSTDFHQSTHDRFLDLKKDEFVGENLSVFLPLCGKSFDILWFYNHGFTVCGVEIAEMAIQQFFSENNIECEVESLQNIGKLYKSKDKKIQLYVADMFKMTPELCGQFDIIWDSKAFVAINKSDRLKYIKTLEHLMKKEGKYYLAAIDYDPAFWPGPPHSCPGEVIESNFGDKFKIQVVEDADQVMKKKSETTEENTEQKNEQKDLASALSKTSYLFFRFYRMTLK